MNVFSSSRSLLVCAVFSVCPLWGIAGSPQDMLGCYAMEENGRADLRFFLKEGAVHWTVRRLSGWQEQGTDVLYFDEERPYPHASAETFQKVEGMFEMGDAFFLIKFRKDRVQDVQGHNGYAWGVETMKRSGSPFLISANGVGPAFPVACEGLK